MSVPDEYKFKIGSIYSKTPADNDEIKIDTGKKWSDGYKLFKENIRKHLKKEQKGRCAFCRCWVSVGTSWSNLEHLVPKDDYPQFMVLSENLVYSCTRCNMSKNTKNTINNPNAEKSKQQFPTDSAGFIILNPYYDNFEDHLDFIDDIIIVVANSSTKGKNTIDFYKLYRPELAEERARELKLDQKTVNAKLLNQLTSAVIEQYVKNQIDEVLKNLPEWTMSDN